MKWLDEADNTIAKMEAQGLTLQPLTREEWLAMSEDDRRQTGPTGGRVVRDVAYRGVAPHDWLMCSRRDLASDAWILWDLRAGRPVVLCSGIPDRALAMSLGSLAATSRATRLLLGGVRVMSDALASAVGVWRRERSSR